MEAVRCVGLGKRFGDFVAVADVSLTLQRGEVLGLLGRNGAGKTTTVRMLCGLIAPTSGTISIMGRPIVHGDESFRSAIGILTEAPGLYERLSLWHNLEYHSRLQGMTSAAFSRRAEELLKRFALWERRDDRVSTFSKGMKQKSAIIRALLHDPTVLFLDEPSSGLDPEAAREVHDTILELKKQGHTVLLTTHRLNEAEELADRIAILQSRLVAMDTVAELRGRLYGRRIAITLADRHDELLPLISALPFASKVERDAQRLIVALPDPDAQTPEVVRTLVNAGASIREVSEVKTSLESMYLDLIAKETTP